MRWVGSQQYSKIFDKEIGELWSIFFNSFFCYFRKVGVEIFREISYFTFQNIKKITVANYFLTRFFPYRPSW